MSQLAHEAVEPVAELELAPVPLVSPRDGVPEVVVDDDAVAAVIARFAAGSGPVAVDAERASGYRYSQRAYLVQLRRAGAGTALIDPIACPDLSPLGAVLADVEWVLHAAGQDLPCLAEVGLRPRTIFDTELGGRLAGYPRVGLGALVESLLGRTLEKGHSAADWSRRPLDEAMLRYAALDVELLVELRNRIESDLADQGKLEWAREEFAAIVAAPPAPPRADPWRRTSGIHRIHNRRQLAAVRALWHARDDIARDRDTAPGRILPDVALISAVLAKPATQAELSGLPVLRSRGARRYVGPWFQALAAAAALPDEELPAMVSGGDAPPPAHRWGERDPAAADRLATARAAVAAIGEAERLPVENLLSPDTLRRLCWAPPAAAGIATAEAVAAALRDAGARAWQVRLTAAAIAAAWAEQPAGTGAES